jgi:hypothetical protein
MNSSPMRTALSLFLGQFAFLPFFSSSLGLASEAPHYRCWSTSGAMLEVNPWEIRVTPAAGMPFDAKVTSVTNSLDEASGWMFTAERLGDAAKSRLKVSIAPNPNTQDGRVPYVGSLTYDQLPESSATDLNCSRR